MNMRILKSIISGCLLLCASYSFSQNKQEVKTNNTTATGIPKVYPQRYGLRVGLDLFRTTRGLYDKSYKGFEVTGDYRFSKNLFLAAELGHDNMTKNKSTYGFTTNGQYIRLGVNYNLYQNWMDREDQIYIGGRYGFSTFSQTLNWYKPYTTNDYFPNNPVDIDREYSGLSAHWIEFVTGVNTRMFNNVFMGFSLRLTALISQKQPNDFENLYIPGFNQKYSGAIGVGFNYTVSYLIPLYKSNKKAFVIPNTTDKYDLEGNKMESEDLKMIQENKSKNL